MKKSMYLMAIVLAGAIAGFTQGAGMGDIALENTMLRQRLDQLDREIQELRQNGALQNNSLSGLPNLQRVYGLLAMSK